MTLKRALILTTLVSAQLALASTAQAVTQGSLKTCKTFQERIDYYAAREKQGGKPVQLESWKREREKFENKFTLYNCKVFEGKLK